MKLAIVQVEIEEAIRAYVKTQINVRDDHEITMEFTATRGDDGLTAAINISPRAPEPEPEVRRGPGRPPKAQTTPVPVPRAVKEAPAATVRETVAATPVEETQEDCSEQQDEPARTVGAEPEEESEVPGDRPLAKAPSIFAGLNKPVNEAED